MISGSKMPAASRHSGYANKATLVRSALGAALGHDVSHQSAQVPELKVDQAIEPQLEIESVREHGYGLGLGM